MSRRISLFAIAVAVGGIALVLVATLVTTPSCNAVASGPTTTMEIGRCQIGVSVLEGALLLLTVIAAFTAIFDARSNSKRQLRAYLFVERAILQDGSTNQPPLPHFFDIPAVSIEVRNSGATPAHNVAHWAGIDVIPIQNERQIVAPSVASARSTTWVPSNGLLFKNVVYGQRLSVEQVEAVNAGNVAIYVYGVIRYTDIFGGVFQTFYRLRHTGSYPPTPNAQLYFCDEGNGAT